MNAFTGECRQRTAGETQHCSAFLQNNVAKSRLVRRHRFTDFQINKNDLAAKIKIMKDFLRVTLPACALVIAGAQASPLFADCWAGDRYSYASDELVATAKKGSLAADVDTIGAALKADQGLTAIGGYRLQLNSFIGFPVGDDNGPNYAEVWVGFHGTDVWQAGCAIDQDAADAGPAAAVRITINDIHALLAVTDAPEDSALAPFPEPTSTSENHGRPVYDQHLLLIAPAGQPALKPYLLRDHFAEWKTRLQDIADNGGGDFATQELDAINAHEKGDGAASLGRQTAFTSEMKPEGAMWAYGLAGGEGTRPRVYLNPALKRAKPMTASFMAVSIDIYKDDPALLEALTKWLHERDFAFLKERLK
jgi:hypothetical protein